MKPPAFTTPRFFIPAKLGLLALALGTQVVLGGLTAGAADEAPSAETATDNNTYRLFYDKLADDGDWFQTNDYGYVFQPRVATEDKSWRPYTDGSWAQTDEGWTWISNEDFGWACYHYGRWANVVDVGWVWVPGPDWSPAYVSWRISKDHQHIGWAPLPPEARVSKTEAVEGWVDNAYDIGPDAYCFIDTKHFGENSYRGHLIPTEQNTTIIVTTENVTRVSYRTVETRTVIYNGGPDVTVIREVTGRPVRELRLETRPENVEFFERGDRRRITEINGNSLVVATAAPDVITSTSIRVSAPAHVNRQLTTVTVDRGYRGIRDPQEAERLRTTLRTQSPPVPPQVQQRASAVLKRDGAAVPPQGPGNPPPPPAERNAANAPAGRNAPPAPPQPALGGPRNEVAPTASVPPAPERPTPGRNEPNPRRPEVAPGATPPTPEGTPKEDRRERNGGKTAPETSPAPRASATPENAREDRSEKRPEAVDKEKRENQPEKRTTPAPEASTPPRPKADRPEKVEEKADAERPRPSANKEREQEKPNPKEADRPAPRSEPAEPRPAADHPENKPAKPEASRDRPERPNEGEAARREEKPRAAEADERKPEPIKPEPGSAPRRAPEEGKEKPVEGAGRERSEKPAPAEEKGKPTPKP